MQNTFQAQINGVTSFIGISCRTSEDWYVFGPTIGKGKTKRCSILKDHLTEQEAEKQLFKIVKNGFNGEFLNK